VKPDGASERRPVVEEPNCLCEPLDSIYDRLAEVCMSNHQTRMRPKVYTVTEFARLFVVSPRLVRELIRKGDIPALKIGRSYRIPRRAADEYLARALPPTLRSAPRPRVREIDELTGFLFPVETIQ
jgi:excisionase family DNA binding protein